LARAEIYNALVELQAVIGGRNTVNGVAGLDASTKIDNTYLPNTITSSGGVDLTIAPATLRTVFQNIIALTPRTVSQLTALTGAAGDIAYCSNGDAGNPCLAVYNGTAWKRIALGTTISAT
jgi:hypothetical protein